MKKILSYICIILLIIILYISIQIIHFGYTTKPLKSDCIIVLGCKVNGEEPSYFLKARLDEAVRLYKNGYANYIIVSGGQGKNELITEAEAMKRYLIQKDIAEQNIIKEEKSHSTYENLLNSLEIMKNNNFNSAIIVSNKYHLKRASLIASRFRMNASFSGCFVREWITYEVIGFLREILALIKFYILKF